MTPKELKDRTKRFAVEIHSAAARGEKLLKEADELTAIFVTSLNTAKR